MNKMLKAADAAIAKGRARSSEDWARVTAKANHITRLEDAAARIEAQLNKRTEPAGVTMRLLALIETGDVEIWAVRRGTRAKLAGHLCTGVVRADHRGVVVGTGAPYVFLRQRNAIIDALAQALSAHISAVITQAVARLP
ncbi:hypothetical protein [Alloyangia pacifica]|uniref:Uncharacterized protein n=1 Tax=Alloyangia pacifica TaxID=311180 RepID=A0A1I6PRF1_9RHOB|nr:hypothetical protein [Alloyangia pacifica]SDG33763.1 hypothetical protein SAMN04488245_102415 [Alloyangia pacifica]SFS42756.1 hypothetical protein SAMN04488050_101716 [Alloyangia pacifica]